MKNNFFMTKISLNSLIEKNNNRIRVATLFVDWEQEWTQNFKRLARSQKPIFNISVYPKSSLLEILYRGHKFLSKNWPR